MPEITQDELEQFKLYKELGSVEDLWRQKNDTVVSTAAAMSNFKKPVLEKLVKTLPTDYNLIVDDDKVFMHTPEGDVELSEFAENEWSEFLPSLTSDVVAESPKVVPHIRQIVNERKATKKDIGKKIADNYIMSQYGWALKTDSVN